MRFTFDGRELRGEPGDTLAAALLRNDVRVVGRSVQLGRPRGIFTAGPEEPNALVRVGADPMLAATTVELYDGLEAWSLRGKGRVDPEAIDDRRCDKGYLHCDVLVVGGGPAGLAAAVAAGRLGARTILVDEQPRLGGDLLNSRLLLDGAPALDWVARLDLPGRVLTRTTAIGYYDHNYVVAVERRARGERLWHIRAREVVLATGAHERSLAFPGNDRPGVMLASAARTYANRYGVAPWRRAVVFACADSGYEAARDLAAAGVEIAAIVDPRPEALPPGALAELVATGGEGLLAELVSTGEDGLLAELVATGGVLTGQVVTGTTGDAEGVLTGVQVGSRHIEADLLAVAGGWNPAVHLFSQSQGRVRFDDHLQAFVPGTSAQRERSAGACRGLYGTRDAIADGYAAGAEAAERARSRPAAAGGSRGEGRVPECDERPVRAPTALWVVDGPSGEPAFADLHRDVTVADLARATGTGMRSVEHVKRYTTAGTGADQGKTSGAVVVGVMSALLGAAPGQVGTTTFRPPYVPVSFATLAGRDRGELSDPVRTTAMHDSHVARGAVFEDVGQWKRPWYFPQDGESMEEAVLRECRAARTDVAAMDASTLGKIDIRGADAGAFLDRIYTNMYSTLNVGACRYGVMCGADGMVLDDGTTTRLAEDHYLMTTTTGNAARVLDWLEEWHQTEWPGLEVSFTSVTDHWATVVVAGPRARRVVAAVAPGAVDLAFMRYVAADVLGVPGRVFRISFSGELAYEVNVPWAYGRALWEAVLGLGAVPYGTETMHVLRAEKGFAIVGQETDGTVTPQDLGMEWIVSRRKPDYVGKRSHARPDTARSDRKRLVGLLPDDPARLVEEGAQLVAADGVVPMGEGAELAAAEGGVPVEAGARLVAVEGRVPMVGHVTSSYRSAALGRTFCLALAKGVGPGDRLTAVSGDGTCPVTVVEPVFYDPGNARRDGEPLTGAPPRHAFEVRAESPAAAFAARFEAAGGARVRLREVPFEPMWEVRGADPGVGLRLGPDWWLVSGHVETRPGWVDVSGQRTILELSGPAAEDVLITGCPLDLHPDVFPGHAQTLLGKTGVILERRAPGSYRVYVRSSFTRYLAEWLLDAIDAI
ncbi:Sarcosine oxidase alpha subunit [[Actinomadura] parvosata subsp. kistnae]|uniref:Ferredoxin n=1 Tax=[Actinomadura] parvosata subsp. kistnae TaxID=1909395 RepID=A0A1V0A6A8_9ACTN|nr:2Fe-2S iron-sulfur cluster-binding protein [Nonomuraea sp. ATCC 55076]AQZ65734.1 ferredoxin [Nonomuraea sp. ATCC 55076]SPL97137.1 Sarcosine oxidase alpha subunit [Actinomadura parvosata subsp. kistnae]